ncbi:MAG: ABC transporter permease [Spirochaetales bacterium]|nr:ABC transporter permease [Spirochaetales bacterium]
MKTLAFASRNTKEILRDVLNLAFGLGFPVIILLLLSFIQSNIPVDVFRIGQLVPGVVVFGFSFFALFAGMLIARDRTSSLMLRLLTSPMTSRDFIFAYILPLLPLAAAQAFICFAVALIFGLPVSIHIVSTVLVLMPAAFLYISTGLLFGSVLTERQVGGVCGALLTNLSAWLSDTWFDIDLVGGAYAAVARALPFYHAVEAGRNALAGNYRAVFPDLWWVIGYAVVLTVVAVLVFRRKMNSD